MIGPTSSFYSPDGSTQAQYQQWLDAIESHSQHTQALTQLPVSSSTLHGPRPQQNSSIFDFSQGRYSGPTTSAINQYIGSGLSQSNVGALDPLSGAGAYQNQTGIFQPFFDLRSITASSSSSHDQRQPYNAATSDSTLQQFSTTHSYSQQLNAQPVFTNPEPQIQPQINQHPLQPSQPIHQPRSLLPRPGRSRQQVSVRKSPQFKQPSSQTRFAVQPQQAHATPSQSNQSASPSSSSSGPQQGVSLTNEQQRQAPSAIHNAGGFYHVSATNVPTATNKGLATGSQRKAVSTTHGTESRWNSQKRRGKRKRSRMEGAQESSTVSEGDSEDDEFAGGISVGMGGVGVVGKREPIGRL